jgi:excisionase family DNA binding protein
MDISKARKESTEGPVLRIEGVAKLLDVKVRTVRRWIESEGLPHAKVGGLLLFLKSSILTWLEIREKDQTARASERVKKKGGNRNKSEEIGIQCSRLMMST